MPKLSLLNRKSAASIYLDILRSIAATMVLLFHARPTFFVPFHDVSHYKLEVALIYILASRGYQAVMVFFVLSGYMVGTRALADILNGSWSWGDYLLNRLSRLWMVLIPALLLTVLWDKLNIHLFNTNIPGYDWRDFWGSIFFLQDTWTISFGNNNPLWSLSYEFWYYILFPSLLLSFRAQTAKGKLVSAIVAALVIILTWGPMLEYFSVWLLGVGVALMPRLKLSKTVVRRIYIASAILLCLTALASTKFFNSGLSHVFSSDLAVGIATAVLIWVIVSLENDRTSKLTFGVTWASFSYTLYLVHYPVLMVISSWIGIKRLQPNLGNIFMFFLVCILIVLYSWIIGWATEHRTPIVRAWLLHQRRRFLATPSQST